MLAGDGARLVDPLLGAGIMNAMVSGRMAGETAASAIKTNDVSAKALQRYDKAVFDKLGKAMRRNYRMKEFIGHVSDRQMNVLFSSARRMNVESVPVAELYRTATTSGLPVMKIIRHIL